MTVPLGWQRLSLNRIIRMRSGNFISRIDIEPEGAYPVYGGNGFRGFTDQFNAVGPVVLVGRQGAHCGNVHVADGQIWVSEHALRCLPEKELDAKWLAYALRDMNLNQYSESAAQPGLAVDNLKHLRTAVPPLGIQKRIARFLDEKTAGIDGLIEKKRELLDRLAEKRQALITRVVTKGLNAQAPMKPSGIDWLGDIPAHWEIAPLRWYLRISSGEGLRNIDIAYDRTETDYAPVIGGNGTMGFTDATNSEKAILVIGRVGAHCGNVHPIDEPSWITDNALRVFDVRNFDREFLLFAIQIRDLNTLASRNAQPLMTGETVKAQCLPCPPLSEQRLIGKELGGALGELETHEARVGETVQLLSEYRAALITTAVTGQLLELR